MTPHVSPHIITVFGGKGGIGKTTIAEHLAWACADEGKTLLVDADTGQQSAASLYTRYQDGAPFDLTVEHDPHLLGKLSSVPYDWVIVDAPPHADQAAAGIEVASLVLVPVVPRILDVQAIMRTINQTLLGRTYRVVLSRVTPWTRTKPNARADAVAQALAGQSVPLLSTRIREYLMPHETARGEGLPLTHPKLSQPIDDPFAGTPFDRAAYDMRAACAEVIQIMKGGER